MPSIKLTPLPAAVKQLTERKVFPSGMTSRDWEGEPAAVRQRLFFASRVEEERILTAMHSKLIDRIQLATPSGATMDKSRFVEEMQKMLTEEGYRRPEGVIKGSLRDLKGYRRLSLIWDMNLAQAEGYARWKSGMTVDGLANEPCAELVRVMDRIDERDWPQIWKDHGGEFYGEPSVDYPNAPGRMIAPKTSEIWTNISRFGTPWPPFDWGSGMGLAGIDIDEAEALGVVMPGDKFTPAVFPFNHKVQASAADIDERGREKLRSDLGDHIQIDNDKITLNNTPSHEAFTEISQSLSDRAAEIGARGRDAFDGLRRADASALPDGFDQREVIASSSAVAVGRKLLYHDEWGIFAEVIGATLRKFLPPSVTISMKEGHLYAYRKELIKVPLDDIHAMSVNATNGRLLGYGADLFEAGTVKVQFLIRGEMVGGFYAPMDQVKTFARARRRDYKDALGLDVDIMIDGKEVTL